MRIICQVFYKLITTMSIGIILSIFAMFGVLAGAMKSEADFLGNYLNILNGYKTGNSINNSGAPMAQLVLSQGYPIEEYEVTTADGYILTVFRIPYGRNSSSTPRRPILLQHGLFATSTAWVISEPSKGLGFVLADSGYDVWISNSRGNPYSMKHMKYDPVADKKEFFDFSFHEMGYYDLPAVIDFMLEKTNSSQIDYVGHSQGTTQFFVLTSVHPDYNQKVRVAALMAPIAYLNDARGAAKVLTQFAGVLAKVAKWMGLYDILSDSPLIHFIDTSMCKKTAATASACDNLLFALVGFDEEQFNQTLLPIIADQGPSGASVKQLVHYAQLSHNGDKFTMYDYGDSENQEHYGQSSPPEYDLSQITVPIHLHYSLNDWLAGVDDVYKVHDHIPSSILIEVPFPKFNHLDFMWAIDVRTLLYDDMIKLLG